MGKHRIPAEQYIPGKGIKRFVKSRQCAAVYHKGNRAGTRCTWYAQADREYCAKHGRLTALSPEHEAKMRAGHASWWARVKALNKQYPGLLRELMNTDQSSATRKARTAVRKALPAPATSDPVILKAHKSIIADVADLPPVPDKPFEELEPHEQLTVITGQSLRVVHEILSFKMADKAGVPQPKIISIVKDTALRALSVRVKVDRNALSARRIDKMGELLERLKANGNGAKVIEG